MSTADSNCDDAAGLSKSSNIWTHVTAIADSDLNPQAQMVVCHNGTTAMAFHAISRAGLVCTKCFKLYTCVHTAAGVMTLSMHANRYAISLYMENGYF